MVAGPAHWASTRCAANTPSASWLAVWKGDAKEAPQPHPHYRAFPSQTAPHTKTTPGSQLHMAKAERVPVTIARVPGAPAAGDAAATAVWWCRAGRTGCPSGWARERTACCGVARAHTTAARWSTRHRHRLGRGVRRGRAVRRVGWMRKRGWRCTAEPGSRRSGRWVLLLSPSTRYSSTHGRHSKGESRKLVMEEE